MKTKQKYEIRKARPANVIKKARAGKFSIALMQIHLTKILKGDDSALPQETPFSTERICIQQSNYNKRTGEWSNQSIWLNEPQDIEHLKEALNTFLESEKRQEEDSQESSRLNEKIATAKRGEGVVEICA